MRQESADFEQRLARFDALVDRFSLTLRQWQAQEQSVSPDARDVERRVKILEETVERESRALRQLHEEPLKQMQAHTASLGELCVAATKSVNGLDQAESRLAAMEADLRLHLTDLSKNFQALVTDMRSANAPATPAAPAPATSWPLERVVQVHGQLRRGMNGTEAAGLTPSASGHAADAPPAAGVTEAAGGSITRDQRPIWWYPIIVLVIIGAASVAIVERRLETRLNDASNRAAAAEQRATAATDAASRQIASARADADRQLTVARRAAERAERIGAILTAPDLVRFPLSGGSSEARLAAQVLWSRTRGLVLSASRLPSAPPDTTYQLWLWANGEAVSAGAFAPDATGAATLVTDGTLKVNGPITNVAVTIEPDGGAATPSGRTLLARVQ